MSERHEGQGSGELSYDWWWPPGIRMIKQREGKHPTRLCIGKKFKRFTSRAGGGALIQRRWEGGYVQTSWPQTGRSKR